MRRILFGILTVVMLLALMPTRALAADESRAYTFELTSDGENTKQVSPGDIVNVVLTLVRTDSDDSYTMYAMQDEIQYDSSFFEFVEGSELISSGIETTDIALRDTYREFYMNFLSLTGGEEWSSKVIVGSFQLKVIAQSGSSVISNENYLVSVQDGSDSYLAQAKDITVVVSTDCTVRFESNGGTKISDQRVQYGEKASKPEDPKRDGYTFAGWYSDLDLQNKWNFEEDAVKGNMTLYAKWDTVIVPVNTAEEDGGGLYWLIPVLILAAALALLVLLRKYKRNTVKFDTDGGTEIRPTSVRRGKKLKKPPVPQIPGVTFEGWYQDEARTKSWDFENDTVGSNMTLYAKWI